jgi:LPS export ABC transporter protein LptC
MSPRRVLAVAFVALLAGGCGEGESRAAPEGPSFDSLEADQVMVGVEHYMTREGVRRAHLRADTVYLQGEGSDAHLRRYTVDFFDGAGGLRSVLRAEDGEYDMQSGDMRASRNVVVVDADQAQRLSTEELRYDASTGKLTSEAPFTLVQGRDTVQGTGFVTDPGLDTLTTRQPRAVYPADTAGPAAPSGTDTLRPPSGGGAAGDTATAQAAPAREDTLPPASDTPPPADTARGDTARAAPADTAPGDRGGTPRRPEPGGEP